jgi:arginyl-tRNA--protein-N-Asp/Glu arginylyltransferase
MKLVFSEYKSDYSHYIFPYAIWAFPEADETPAMILNQGFLPSSHNLERFYLCRNVRVNLKHFTRSSENRRIIRKGEGIDYKLIPRGEFNFTPEWREFFKNYTDSKFGDGVLTDQRLDSLFSSKAVSHILQFHDNVAAKDVGVVLLYLEPPQCAFYYYSFYDLDYHTRSLGMFMMTSTVDYFANQNYNHIYLGTCYSQSALYKTQFTGAEFFNGVKWSDNLEELKYLIQRDQGDVEKHLLESPEYIEKFWEGNNQIALSNASLFTNFPVFIAKEPD